MDDDIVTGSRTIIKNGPKEGNVIQQKKKDDYDLNGDGVVDKKDMSIAGKTLVSGIKKMITKKIGEKK